MSTDRIQPLESCQDRDSESATGTVIATQTCLFFLVAFLGCGTTIFTTLSKNKENKYDYETISVPLFMEIAKLAISFVLLVNDSRKPKQLSFHAAITATLYRVRESLSWQYAILGILYGIQNNLLFFTLRYLDPGTLHILGNLRIPATAIMLFYILRRSYSIQQVSGIVLLTVGAVSYSVGKYNSRNEARASVEMVARSQYFGYALCLLMTLSGSIAGVFNEYCLKKSLQHQSVDLQNVQLYLFGSILNFVALSVKQQAFRSVFKGYNILTICIIINSACFGVSVGYITKYCDNNVRSFAGVASMLLAAMYSSVFMSIPLPSGYPVSLFLVFLGVLMYSKVFKINP